MKILIKGSCGEGKTVIASFIKQQLELMGIESSIQDNGDPEPEPEKVQAAMEKTLRYRSKTGKLNITIETVNAVRSGMMASLDLVD